MAVYKRPESTLWYYEFQVTGTRYRGSTRSADEITAQSFVVELRAKITLGKSPSLRKRAPPAPQLQAVIEARRALKKLRRMAPQREGAGAPNEVRRLWGALDAALAVGRSQTNCPEALERWCRERGLEDAIVLRAGD